MLKVLTPLDLSRNLIFALSYTLEREKKYNVRIIYIVNLLSKIKAPELEIVDKEIDDEIMILKGIALDNASQLELNLGNFLISYFLKFPSNIRLIKQMKNIKNDLENIKIQIHKRDFMWKRDLLSLILKKDLKLGGVNKKNTTLFFKFIVERNKYAHGIFCFEYPTYNPLIGYKDNKGKILYAKVNSEIIESFNKTYFNLNEWLSDLNNLIIN